MQKHGVQPFPAALRRDVRSIRPLVRVLCVIERHGTDSDRTAAQDPRYAIYPAHTLHILPRRRPHKREDKIRRPGLLREALLISRVRALAPFQRPAS